MIVIVGDSGRFIFGFGADLVRNNVLPNFDRIRNAAGFGPVFGSFFEFSIWQSLLWLLLLVTADDVVAVKSDPVLPDDVFAVFRPKFLEFLDNLLLVGRCAFVGGRVLAEKKTKFRRENKI